MLSLSVVCDREAWIPWVLAFSTCISNIGAGMTVKFFPIYFQTQLLLTPVQLSFVYLGGFLSASGSIYMAQRVRSHLFLQFADSP